MKKRGASAAAGKRENKKAFAIWHAEQRFKLLFENANDLIVAVDGRGRIIDINRRVKSLVGFTRKECLHRYLFRLPVFRPEEIPGLKKAFRRAVVRGKLIRVNGKNINILECCLRHRNGRDVFVEASTRVVPMRRLGPVYVSVVRDITKRKLAEEALGVVQERFKSFMESANEGFVLFDADLNVVDINDYLLKEFSAAKKDVVGLNMIDISLEAWESGRFELYKKVIATGRSWAHELTAPVFFGNRYLAIKAFKVGDGMGMIISDRTRERLNARKLAESEQKFRTLYEAVQAGVLECSADGRILHINSPGRRILEFAGALDENTRLNQIIEWLEDKRKKAPGVLNPALRAVHTGRPVSNALRCVRLVATGKVRWLMVNAVPRADPETGIVEEVVMTITDQTERTQTQIALKGSEHKYRHLFNNCHIGIGVTALDGQVFMANRTMQKLLGYSMVEMKNLKLTDLTAEPEEQRAIRDVLDRRVELIDYPVRLRNRAGKQLEAILNITKITIDGKDCFQTICQPTRRGTRIT